MMKKNYIQPITEIYETPATRLLAGSAFVDNDGLNVVIGSTDDEIDAAEGCAREFDDFVDSFFKVMLLLVMMTFGLSAGAQKVTTVSPADAPADGKKHGMTLYFKDNTQLQYTIDQLEHVTYLPGIGMKVYVKGSETSVDFLFSQMTQIDYQEDDNANANYKAFSMADYQYAYRLEYPHLSDNVSPTADAAKSQVIVKETDDYGITYSLEWDNAKIANRWTCYTLHAGNSLSSVDRHDDFKADPDVAVSATLADYSGSGFSRGHLCPSADRLCTTEQNKQTFYLTNMQPQYQTHNGGLWGRLEAEVRNFATDDSYTDSHCDTLYIVKAATISDKVTIGDEEVDGVYSDIKCGSEHQLLVPKYFYMALLHYNKETDTYQALAFWTEHINEIQSVADLSVYAITIDELEKRTGIDFFCNLPDEIEHDVEAAVDLKFWHLK